MKLDPVDQKTLKGSHKNAKDKDINNDGKVNSSDEYLHNRRQAVSKAIGKLKEEALEEKKLTTKDVKNALASAKAKPKETVSLKKPPFKMEESELDEVSDKKLDAYRQKAFADQPAGDDGSDKYRKRKFGRDLAFDKQVGRAKVRATKEESELDEAKKAKPGHNAMVMAKNISKVLSVVKKEKVDLDEVSQDKLYDYHAKAAADLRAKRAKLDQGSLTMNDLKKGQNRVKGLNTAANKMKEETHSSKDVIFSAMNTDKTDDASTIAKHTKPLRMKLSQFRHEE